MATQAQRDLVKQMTDEQRKWLSTLTRGSLLAVGDDDRLSGHGLGHVERVNLGMTLQMIEHGFTPEQISIADCISIDQVNSNISKLKEIGVIRESLETESVEDDHWVNGTFIDVDDSSMFCPLPGRIRLDNDSCVVYLDIGGAIESVDLPDQCSFTFRDDSGNIWSEVDYG